jgi:hypothetical protein
MSALFEDPMVQAGLAPFLVALVLALLVVRVRLPGLPGLALVAAMITTLWLTTGIGFTPLSASRKVVLVVLLAPMIGLVLDLTGQRHRLWLPAVAVLLGGASLWVFQSLLVQLDGAAGWWQGGGVALFVALMTGLTLRLRDDGPAAAAAALGLGLAVGVGALSSASIGTLMNGMALAAGGGALLLVQFLLAARLATGWTAALTTAAGAALFAAGTVMLAEGRALTLALLLLVPLVVGLPLFQQRAPRLRTALLGLSAGVAALLPMGAAWFATGASAV